MTVSPEALPPFPDTTCHYAVGTWQLRNTLTSKPIIQCLSSDLPIGLRRTNNAHGYLYARAEAWHKDKP